jgi:hypothetical protein
MRRAVLLAGLVSCTVNALNVRNIGKPFFAKHKRGGRHVMKNLEDAATSGSHALRGAASAAAGPGTLTCPNVSVLLVSPFIKYLFFGLRRSIVAVVG